MANNIIKYPKLVQVKLSTQQNSYLEELTKYYGEDTKSVVIRDLIEKAYRNMQEHKRITGK